MISQDNLLQLAYQDDAPSLSFVGLQLAVTQLAQQIQGIIIVNNQRTLPICPCCEVPLPPWPHQRSDPHASVLINAFVGGGSCLAAPKRSGGGFTFHASVLRLVLRSAPDEGGSAFDEGGSR